MLKQRIRDGNGDSLQMQAPQAVDMKSWVFVTIIFIFLSCGYHLCIYIFVFFLTFKF